VRFCAISSSPSGSAYLLFVSAYTKVPVKNRAQSLGMFEPMFDGSVRFFGARSSLLWKRELAVSFRGKIFQV
jgi:hypothetical protein